MPLEGPSYLPTPEEIEEMTREIREDNLRKAKEMKVGQSRTGRVGGRIFHLGFCRNGRPYFEQVNS